MLWIIATCALACLPAALFTYIIGVRVGRRYERRVITVEFQDVLNRLLHYAAQRDYQSLHLMLIDLCADENLVDQIRYHSSSETEDNLSKIQEAHLAPRDLQDTIIPAGTTVSTEKKPTH